jgi:ubiquinone/menaquinone biosynthesis C-methylase UbiE
MSIFKSPEMVFHLTTISGRLMPKPIQGLSFNMDDHKSVYANEAERYDALVTREDYQGNILKSINRVVHLEGKDVVEFGAGTGRLSVMLAPVARIFRGYDSSPAMLEVAERKLKLTAAKNWNLGQADNRSIPLPDACVDLVISGWSICYFATWGGNDWKKELYKSFAEMKRILRVGGRIILLETMGTGFETPAPTDHLLEYYQVLAGLKFKSDWFRTDYRFLNLTEAVDLVNFFFGKELSGKVAESGILFLPECTGIWYIDKEELILPD